MSEGDFNTWMSFAYSAHHVQHWRLLLGLPQHFKLSTSCHHFCRCLRRRGYAPQRLILVMLLQDVIWLLYLRKFRLKTLSIIIKGRRRTVKWNILSKKQLGCNGETLSLDVYDFCKWQIVSLKGEFDKNSWIRSQSQK